MVFQLRILISLIGCVSFVATSAAQATQISGPREEASTKADPRIFAERIQASNIEKHLYILASPELEGRETGTEGERMANEYIAEHFRNIGLPPVVGEEPSYFQKIAYTAENWEGIQLRINKTDFRHLWDFYAFPATNPGADIKTKNVLFLGYGIDAPGYNDFEGNDVRGKVLLVYSGEPVNANGIYYLSGTEQPSEWSENWRLKLEAAHRHGAAAVLLIDGNIKQNIAEQRRKLLSPGFRIGRGEEPEGRYAPNIFVSSNVAREMMGKRFDKVVAARDQILASGKPQSLKLKAKVNLFMDKRTRQIIGRNVLGYIEGSDPELKDELIVITAHLDHLGKRGDDIFFGADDNGSGTSSVLEIARVLAEAKQQGAGPRRSVLCMLVSGEEKGLLGSKYYVENPIFPLEQTVANINVDMIGRTDSKYEGKPNYVYVIGSDRLSMDLHDINEAANERYTNLILDYTYNAEDDPNRYYYRSDHYNFAERGIPAIFFFSGVHEDYHQPSDTPDKINYQKAEITARLVFHTCWELANRDERIRLIKGQTEN
jgi:hypothetical protein